MPTKIAFPESETQLEEYYANPNYTFDTTKKAWFDSGTKDTIPSVDPTIPVTQDSGIPEIPSTAGEAPNLSDFQAQMDKMQKDIEIRQKAADDAAAAAEKARTDAQTTGSTIDKMLEDFASGKTVEEKRAEEETKLGIDEKAFLDAQNVDMAEIASLMESYDLLVAKQEQDVLNLESRTGGTADFKQRRVNQLKKEQNIELSLKAAQVKTKLAIREMKNGNFADAKKLVDEAVNDYVYDQKLEYDQLIDFREENQDLIADLDKSYQDALDDSTQASKDKYDLAFDKATAIGDLILKYNQYGAGIEYTDTIEEAYKKGGIAAQTEQARLADIEERELRIKEKDDKSTNDLSSVDSWVNLLSTGQAGVQNIPSSIRNEVVRRAAELGIKIISPTFARASAESISSFNSANSQLDIINESANKVIKATDAFGLMGQNVEAMISRIPWIGASLAPEMKIYNDSVESFVSMLTRAAGEKGVLTNVDVARVRKSLPSISDTIETANQKMSNFRGLLESIKNGSIDAYTAQQYGLKIKTDTTTQTSDDGTTIMTAPDGSKWNVPNNQVTTFKQNGYK